MLIGSTRFSAVAGQSRRVYLDEESKCAAAGAASIIARLTAVSMLAVRRMPRAYEPVPDRSVPGLCQKSAKGAAPRTPSEDEHRRADVDECIDAVRLTGG